MLFKGFVFRDRLVLRQVYLTYDRPVLEYASNVWSPYTLKDTDAIEKVQRHFTKHLFLALTICDMRNTAALDLEPLELRRLKSDITLYFKIINHRVCIPADNFFAFSTMSTSHHHDFRIVHPLCKTEQFSNNFFNHCVECCNYLPTDVVCCHYVLSFKLKLNCVDKNRFLSSCFLQQSLC
jgi:hypothetical protein